MFLNKTLILILQLLHPVLKTLFAGAVSLVNMNIRDYFFFYYSLAIKNMFMMFGTPYLSLCLLRNFFCDETSRT